MSFSKHLIIAPNWIGDAIFSHGLIKVIKNQYPEADIDVLAHERIACVYEMMPEVNQIHGANNEKSKLNFWTRVQIARKISKQNYTHAYIINNAWKHALIPFLARIPNRIGWLGEFRFILVNQWRLLNKKMFPDMLSKLSSLGLPKNKQLEVHYMREQLYPKLQANKQNQFKILTNLGLHQSLSSNKPIVAISPGSDNGTSKRWPATKYAFLIQKLIKINCEVWIFGSPKEKNLSDYIMQHTGKSDSIHNLTGRTNLDEALDILGLCNVAVCNDSGLLHASAALGLGVVAIYGPTSENFAPPLTVNKAVITEDVKCRPCNQHECPFGHHACMETIEVDRVLSKVKFLLEKKKSA